MTMVRPDSVPIEKSLRAQNGNHHDVVTENVSDHETLRLIGTTKFVPRSDIKNIMITGGAGFM